MLKLSFDSKGYGVKNPTFYVLDLVCLTSLIEIKRQVSTQWAKLPKKQSEGVRFC